MTHSKYFTRRGRSGSGLSEYIPVYDRGYNLVGSAKTIDGGQNWFISGLFRETACCFADLQTAVEQITFLYEQALTC